ncbi:hypothetical protein VKT23_018448 [Stygiomarasmius scandens]|uniref:Uncharacterized protein n=1 Tax=Marasmiellus scandens TaxID=2682957 RepID=A0ABR1ISN9_9AGAR
MVFDLDGQKFTQYQPAHPGPALMHQVYFRKDELPPGNHTLIGTVIGATGNGSAIIDYITYKPSFGRLSAKPNFQISGSNQTRPSDVPKDPTSNTKFTPPIIVGLVIGVVVFVAILGSLTCYLLKKSPKYRKGQKKIHQPNFSKQS